MYTVKSFFLTCALLSLIQPIRTFCIYNALDYNSGYINVQQNRQNMPYDRLFTGRINRNDKKCCHYSDRDCSPNGTSDDPVEFTITIIAGLISSAKHYRVKCTTGGGLTIQDRENGEPFASCQFANNTAIEVPLSALN